MSKKYLPNQIALFIMGVFSYRYGMAMIQAIDNPPRGWAMWAVFVILWAVSFGWALYGFFRIITDRTFWLLGWTSAVTILSVGFLVLPKFIGYDGEGILISWDLVPTLILFGVPQFTGILYILKSFWRSKMPKPVIVIGPGSEVGWPEAE